MNLPNTITLIRFMLHPLVLIIFAINPEKYSIPALVLYITCSLMDVLDGYVARATNTSTDFGRFFDGTADKVASLTLMALFTYIIPKYFPVWFFLVILTRDLIVEGARQFVSLRGIFPKPQRLGKAKVFLQTLLFIIGFLLFTTLHMKYQHVFILLILFLEWAIILSGLYSMILYLVQALCVFKIPVKRSI